MPQAQPRSKQSQHLAGIVEFASASALQKEFERAEEYFRKALKERPSDPYLLSRLSSSLCGQRRFEEAIEVAQHAIAADPNCALAHTALSTALFRADQYEQSLTAAREVIRLSPSSGFGYIAACYPLYEMGRSAELLQMAESGLASGGLTVKGRALGLQLRSLALALLNRKEESLATIAEFTELLPGDYTSHGNAAWVYWWLGKEFVKQASDHARHALAMLPTHDDAHLLMGLILEQQNDIQGARMHFEEALRICPGRRRVREALDSLNEKTGLTIDSSPA